MRIEAAFDCLTITSQLEDIGLRPTRGEIHLLAYLASLLSLYARRGQGASDWGYSFAATPGGAPFSESLQVELDELTSRGAVTSEGPNLRLSPVGTSLQQALYRLNLVKDRYSCLDSASTTLCALPVGIVRAAFAQDPDAILVAEHRHSRELASESALARLYSEFGVVAEVLSTARGSLLAVSILWLTYLAERATAPAR